MTPIPPPTLTPEQEEEARRQAEAQAGSPVGDALEATGHAADLASIGALDVVVDAAGTVLGATVDVAKAGLEVVGGLFGAIGDL
ncbi:hypothetical protein G3576_01435 [Roseomonas stagni]|uniref:Uncharacterized protein n=1 Tax=Falsiroseomonas algicola TaxID=2716930 RepID=A0A6M1LES2_9PROT|nr:hypothetical protein [Falsiroseomonas algicola]NGM18657.1 hypothetical protein [Falsiroseomonas algicola]